MFRVIETFSGIGSQAKALTRIGKPFEIVNTADWDINAILAYCLSMFVKDFWKDIFYLVGLVFYIVMKHL